MSEMVLDCVRHATVTVITQECAQQFIPAAACI